MWCQNKGDKRTTAPHHEKWRPLLRKYFTNDKLSSLHTTQNLVHLGTSSPEKLPLCRYAYGMAVGDEFYTGITNSYILKG